LGHPITKGTFTMRSSQINFRDCLFYCLFSSFFLYSFNVVNNYVAIYGEVSADRPIRKNAVVEQSHLQLHVIGLHIFVTIH